MPKTVPVIVAFGVSPTCPTPHDAAAIPRRILTLSTASAAVAMLAWPLVYSADAFSYAAYGVEGRGIDAEVLEEILAQVKAEHLAQHDDAASRCVAGVDDL